MHCRVFSPVRSSLKRRQQLLLVHVLPRCTLDTELNCHLPSLSCIINQQPHCGNIIYNSFFCHSRHFKPLQAHEKQKANAGRYRQLRHVVLGRKKRLTNDCLPLAPLWDASDGGGMVWLPVKSSLSVAESVTCSSICPTKQQADNFKVITGIHLLLHFPWLSGLMSEIIKKPQIWNAVNMQGWQSLCTRHQLHNSKLTDSSGFRGLFSR